MVIEGNPILARRFRGGELESLHRGCWAVVDVGGAVLASAGDSDQPIFARSASKSLQALGPLGAGVVERFGLSAQHLALMISSHNGEPIHAEVAESLLHAAGLDSTALRCGVATPKAEPLVEPRRIVHNCSGKHSGFLAGAVALGQDPTTYLDPNGAIQQAVQREVVALADMGDDEWQLAIDGCSAPTFVLPLRRLAQAIARVASPDELSDETRHHCRLLTEAAAAHPELVAGDVPARFDTALMRASKGRLFAKGGADGVQVIGVRGAGIAFAGKVDDGNDRGLVPVAIEVLGRLDHIDAETRDAVHAWIDPVIRNADDLEVGVQELAPINA